METFLEDLFKTVKASIVSADERQVVEVLGGGGAGGGWGDGDSRIAVFG